MSFNHAIDIPLWSKIQEQLAAKIGTYVYTLDIAGNTISSAGVAHPFFDRIRTTDPYKLWQRDLFTVINKEIVKEYDPAGFLNIIVPLHINNKLQGCCIISSLVVDKQKLTDIDVSEQDTLQQHDEKTIESYMTLLELLSQIMLPVIVEKNTTTQNISDLELVLEYLNQVSFVLDQEQLIQLSIGFFVRKLRLSNGSVHFNKKTYRYHSNESVVSIYEQIESVAAAHVRNSNSLLIVPDLKKDFLFEKIDQIDKMPPALLAAPLPEGFLFLYADRGLRDIISTVSSILEKFTKALEKTAQYKSAQDSAVTDSLTGIYNRAYFSAALQTELARANQQDKATSAVIFDIDDFKLYNDTYGHLEGDEILKQVVNTVNQELTAIDTFCRYGGEEFVLLFPYLKPEDAYQKADKIRRAVEQATDVTISVGLVTCLNSSARANEMFKEADKALYKAKHAGKNRVINFIIVDKSLGVIDAQDAGRIGKS